MNYSVRKLNTNNVIYGLEIASCRQPQFNHDAKHSRLTVRTEFREENEKKNYKKIKTASYLLSKGVGNTNYMLFITVITICTRAVPLLL